jgi:hypothetical protein
MAAQVERLAGNSVYAFAIGRRASFGFNFSEQELLHK